MASSNVNFDPDSFAKFDSQSSQSADEVLRRIHFQGSLTENHQVLEVGCGTGRFARQYLLTHCRICRRIVATDCDPDMIDFAKKHFAHDDIVHDLLDITTPCLDMFLERYGKFDRIFSFLVFHMIRDQKTAYANIAKLLNPDGECLVVAMSSLDTMDVWLEVYKMPKWKGRIPDPRNVFNASVNFNWIKSAAQVEAEVRDTLRGTGILLTIFPFKAFVPAEEWGCFRDSWAELMHRQLSPTQGEPLALKFTFYVVHGRRSTN
ncbi:hypothetical protein HPB51_008330 [Rhipicephalus microplus]|uniref:Methyltransferase type 12 domain-containing protein n=1 Tax=Rhipicephalus microplus TaxID=6941 RepID=A0A9J6ES29_RHIMP|nr:hypothetical protein HPB51_008330 [Rhipicephalus microplus]